MIRTGILIAALLAPSLASAATICREDLCSESGVIWSPAPQPAPKVLLDATINGGCHVKVIEGSPTVALEGHCDMSAPPK